MHQKCRIHLEKDNDVESLPRKEWTADGKKVLGRQGALNGEGKLPWSPVRSRQPRREKCSGGIRDPRAFLAGLDCGGWNPEGVRRKQNRMAGKQHQRGEISREKTAGDGILQQQHTTNRMEVAGTESRKGSKRRVAMLLASRFPCSPENETATTCRKVWQPTEK